MIPMPGETTRVDFESHMAEIAARRPRPDPCPEHPQSPQRECPPCTAELRVAQQAIERKIAAVNADRQCHIRFPARYRDAAVDHPDVAEWVQAIAADPAAAPSLLLLGATGRGKTHAAYAALRAATVARPSIDTWLAITTADLLASLRPRADVDTEATMAGYRDAGILLIDDLGVAKHSEWTEETLYRIIDARYVHMRPTIYTTNLPLDALRDAIGDRIASRLSETCTRVVLDGPDRRRRPA